MVGMKGKQRPASGDPGRALRMNKCDAGISQGGQDLPGAKPGAILSKADVAHIMEAVFTMPMPQDQFRQALG